MSDPQFAAGYRNGGKGLYMPPGITKTIERDYYCSSPLGDMANWNADPTDMTMCHGAKLYYETSAGLSADEACDDVNGQVTLLTQNFYNDSLELCGEAKYSLKKDEADAIRMCDRWAAQQAVLNEDLKQWLEKKTVPYALATLIGSAHPLSQGHNAVGVVNTPGMPNGLGSLENPLKIDVTSPRNGGNVIQPGTITTGTLLDRMINNMHAQGVYCSNHDIMVFGGSGLNSGFRVDELCKDSCSLIQTDHRFKISTWAFSAVNSTGKTVHYVAMYDTNKFWFRMHQLYLKWVAEPHFQTLTGDTIWGAKVNDPKAVTVAAVQYV
jgi:hypothetical protein